MRQRRCLVGAAVMAPDYGRTLVIGHLVDLDERLPQGGTLADVVREDWFGPVEAGVAQAQAGPHTLMESPAIPAAEEDIDG